MAYRNTIEYWQEWIPDKENKRQCKTCKNHLIEISKDPCCGCFSLIDHPNWEARND